MGKPTKAQLEFIATIEDAAPEPFTGTTKREASAYIDKYLPRLRAAEDLEGKLIAILHEDAGDRLPY